MLRKTVLLPPPLPPMIMNMSPLLMVKVRSCRITLLPYATVRSCTTICGSAFSISTPYSSDIQHIANNGYHRHRHNDADYACHHRRGCCFTDSRSTSSGLDPAETARKGHEDAEDRGTEKPDPHVVQLHG